MVWGITLAVILAVLIVIFLSGIPVAFAFLLFNLLGVMYFMGGAGIEQLIVSMFSSLTKFQIAPVPLFIFMGTIMFYSGMAQKVIDVMDNWLGRMPGRLSVLTLGAGTAFATLSGSTLATSGTLGTLMIPDMERRGYSIPMTVGPIMGVGGLAMIIPPSNLAVILGSLGKISIGELLIGGILPGLLIAGLYVSYIIGRCYFQPSMAPSYSLDKPPVAERLKSTLKYALPLIFIIVAVLGSIFFGVATPTEAAALGAMTSLILCAAYGKLNLKTMSDSSLSAVKITTMIFMIIAGSMAFSQILSFSGVSRELTQFITRAEISPMLILIGMMLTTLVLGTFMEQIAIMMITLPIYMPVIRALGFNDVWFGILMLINIEVALTTPPFGMICFIMKGVTPKHITLTAIYRATIPFILCDIIAIILIILFPAIVTFLPDLMR
ncbi:MAG: TRAP transporter large permease subunit [Desulfobacteraceae bacterium]|nr:TRAP transporter large permease subunit [Desulfobacteraceae bacterium]MCF8093818.1 TRAP transporter large permease subunit [Desulfobacteraceae bacterium]